MKWFYDLVVFFCALPGLLWFRPKKIYEGGKKVRVKGGVLTIANHVGYCDPLYLLYGVIFCSAVYKRQIDSCFFAVYCDLNCRAFFYLLL